MEKRSVLLIGDSGIDIYRFGAIKKMSAEAPVPVIEIEEEFKLPAMAANVYHNLINFGLEVDFVRDRDCVKTRFLDAKTKAQLLRVDQDVRCRPPSLPDLNNYDVIVFSDYGKGTVTERMIMDVRRRFMGPILVDTKFRDLAKFEGCIVKINALEHSLITSFCSDLIVTHSANGVAYGQKMFPAKKVPVFDVTGAGDTFLAALALGQCMDLSIDQSIEMAIDISAITVQHLGAYAPTQQEIYEHLSDRG